MKQKRSIKKALMLFLEVFGLITTPMVFVVLVANLLTTASTPLISFLAVTYGCVTYFICDKQNKQRVFSEVKAFIKGDK